MRGYVDYFNKINKYGTDLLKEFIHDEQFLRYCKLLTDDPLNEPCNLEELKADLISNRDVNGLIDLRVVPVNIQTEGKVRIHFFPATGTPQDEITSKQYFYISIIVPNDYAILYGLGQWRAVCIADRIYHHIANKPITGLGTCSIKNWKHDRTIGNPDYEVLDFMIEVESGNDYTKLLR